MTAEIDETISEKNISSEFRHLQYETLISLWTHHNATRLQWPAVVIGAAFLVIASETFSNVVDVQAWGIRLDLITKTGVPLLLAGVGIVTMIYIMDRATKHMTAVEQAIEDIEEQEGLKKEHQFRQINHQSGLSGPRLMKWFMIIGLAIPMTLLGVLVCFGPVKGGITWLIGAVSYQVWMYLVK